MNDILSLGPWQSAYNLVETVFVLFDALLLFGIIFSWLKLEIFRPRIYRRMAASDRNAIEIKRGIYRAQWESVARKASFTSPDSLRVAIIEADAMVDRLLKQIGFKGDTLAERLQRIKAADLASLERVWRAHKIRNHLAHTPGYKITSEEAKAALEDYESFFKELGIL